MTREEAIALIRDWDGPATPRRPTEDSKIARALELWAQGMPIAGTIAERYLAETRRIDVTRLPVNVSDSLRFLARCPFGVGSFNPACWRLCAIRRATSRPASSASDLNLREGQGLQARAHAR